MTAEQAALLSEFNFIVAVDASGSMGETDMPGGKSRWEYMQETLVAFTREILTINTGGIEGVAFGGQNITSVSGKTADAVKLIFSTRSPRGSTPLAQALTESLKLAKLSDKKAVILVFTDGVPDDRAEAARVIVNQANSQETDDECTILFIQVGHDVAATKYLRSLDDDLIGAKFDIVDTKTIDEAENFPTIVDLVCAAIKD